MGCAKPLEEDPDVTDDVPMMHSGGRLRMASISESRPVFSIDHYIQVSAVTETDAEYDTGAEKDELINRRLSEAHFTDLREKENPLE